jgi:phage terminase large subunit-like protein
MDWSTSCQDWEHRIVKGKSLITNPPLFPEEAYKAISVFKELKLVDVYGHPTFGQVGKDWVFDFVGSIFGSYDPIEGRRLINEFFLLISKKNSKSTNASGIMLTALILNWRDSAEFLILAPTVEIANNSFYPARDMVRNEPELSDLMNVQEHYRQITHRNTGATLKVIAADSEAVGGKKATGILVDELWQFGKKQNAENMLVEATGGLASRPEGFVIYLSTQSDDQPAGVFSSKLKYARKVRDGEIEDKRFLPVIYEFPQKMIKEKTYLDKKNWYVTNPNIGASVDESYIEHKLKEATESGEDSVVSITSKHLNIEVGIALKSKRWSGADFWMDCAGQVTLDLIFELCDVVTIGIDGGGLDDLLGLAVLGRMKPPPGVSYGTSEYLESRESLIWMLWSKAWCHPIALERRKSEISRYRDFERDGDLIIVDNPGDDVKQVGEIVQLCEDSGLFDRAGVDPVGIGEIVDEFELRELARINKRSKENDRVVSIPQGYKLNGAVSTLERRLAGGKVVHGNQAMLNWSVGNARVEQRGNAVLITKQVSGRGKIDPLMAVFDAVALMTMNPEARRKGSPYDGLTTEQIKERMRL